MSEWSILVVDDEQAKLEEIEEALTGLGDNIVVTTETIFNNALSQLTQKKIDMVVLDLKNVLDTSEDDDEAGIRILNEIKNRWFVPVIFYTALDTHVKQLVASPFIQVVPKAEGVEALIEAVHIVLNSRLPHLNRGLLTQIELIQRDYMWGFVKEHWNQLGTSTRHLDLAHLLLRRLGLKLSASDAATIARLLQEEIEVSAVAMVAEHPMRALLYPPLNPDELLMGSICKHKTSGTYFVVLTPSCSLVGDRDNASEKILMAECKDLTTTEEYKKYKSNPDRYTDSLHNLLKNKKKERHHAIHGGFDIPNLIVDFVDLIIVPRDEFSQDYNYLATLDSPYAENLSNRFMRFYSRIGTPDIDINHVINEISRDT